MAMRGLQLRWRAVGVQFLWAGLRRVVPIVEEVSFEEPTMRADDIL